MRILIVGAGLTGCTLARLMKDKQYDVSIIEKENHIGGLCYTKKSPNGILYEPFGAHSFHTNDIRVRDFVIRFSDFNNYKHKKGIILDGNLWHFPLSKESIQEMKNCNQILKELNELPKNPDLTNFETYSISKFGITLYKLFMYNYSKKMWGIEPRELTPEYIKNRIDLKNSKSSMFEEFFQGLPSNGYTEFLKNMISDIPLKLNTTEFDSELFDLVLYSGRIDLLHDFKFGSLEFRSLKYEYRENEKWENNNYGTINLPQHHKYIRKVNFKILHQQQISESLIQYQEPIAENDKNEPLYPIYTKKNIQLFHKYLEKACDSHNIIPIGRLGLYKYLEMGQAMSLAMNQVPLIDKWMELNPNKRYNIIKNLLAN